MISSYIEKLHVKNFRQFSQLDVTFNKGFNFLSGPNGCGKTSVLAGISHCFHHGSFQYSRFQEDSELWTDLSIEGELKRVGVGKNSIKSQGYRQQSIKAWRPPQKEENRESVVIHEAKSKLAGFCPLFIGAERSIKYKQINGMRREDTLERQIQQYTNNGTSLLYGGGDSSIKQWFINRYFIIDKEWAKEERENWSRLIEFLPSIAPSASSFSYVKTGRELEPIFSIYGEECYMEELSAGFQAVLSIVANIFEWVEGTRPEGNRLVSKASGSVLIDELDLHLHPEWQFSLRDGLEKLFPNLQFIVTTHSPHLLASAKENEIIIMDRVEGKKEYNIKPTPKKFNGWNTDQILSDLMGVVSLENKDYENLISQAFDSFKSDSEPKVMEAIEKLSKVAHPSDSIITVLKLKYASMIARSDD